MNWKKGDYTISDDRSRVDMEALEALLRTTYWASDRPRETIEASLTLSTCFSLFCGKAQVGFARVVSDEAVFAWIGDVVISEAYRGKGLGRWLVSCMLEHHCVKKTRFQILQTKDAHGLYERFGFERGESMRREA